VAGTLRRNFGGKKTACGGARCVGGYGGKNFGENGGMKTVAFMVSEADQTIQRASAARGYHTHIDTYLPHHKHLPHHTLHDVCWKCTKIIFSNHGIRPPQ